MRRGPLALLFITAVVGHLASPRSAAADEPATPSVAQCLSASEQGQLARDDGHYTKARALLLTCSSGACPAVVQRDCLKWLAEIDTNMPTLVFVVRSASGSDERDVVVRIDGQVLVSRLDGMPVAVDPGEHVFSFQAGARRVESRALVNVGERNRVVRVTFEDAAPPVHGPEPAREQSSPSAVPLGSLVLGGAGLVALGTSAVLWLTATSDLKSLESDPCATTKTCAESDVKSVRTRMIVGDVLAGMGVAALGAAAVLWLTRDRSVAMTVSPLVMGRGSLLRVDASF